METLSKEEGAKVQQLEDIKQKLELLLQEEKQALRDEEIGKKLLYLIFIALYAFVESYNKLDTPYVYRSTKFTSKSTTRRMGKERAIGEIAAGAAGIVGDGENEENGV